MSRISLLITWTSDDTCIDLPLDESPVSCCSIPVLALVPLWLSTGSVVICSCRIRLACSPGLLFPVPHLFLASVIKRRVSYNVLSYCTQLMIYSNEQFTTDVVVVEVSSTITRSSYYYDFTATKATLHALFLPGGALTTLGSQPANQPHGPSLSLMPWRLDALIPSVDTRQQIDLTDEFCRCLVVNKRTEKHMSWSGRGLCRANNSALLAYLVVPANFETMKPFTAMLFVIVIQPS